MAGEVRWLPRQVIAAVKSNQAMHLNLNAFSRFRPRILTLIVFCLSAAVIVLANLSFDEVYEGDWALHHRSFGWPIIWHRLVLNGHPMFVEKTIGWYYSIPRLAANVVLWSMLLGALAGTCEWLLRRYRPRPRWSLRTLLVVVGLVAAGCGWFAKARNRAAIQDQLIPIRGGYGVPLVFVERTGPKWLDLLGVDRYRRRIVLASGWQLDFAEPGDEQRFLQLARLTDVLHVTGFRVGELTPTTAKALASMQHLETLDITLDRLTPEFAAALSDLRQLRYLSISQNRNTADDDYLRLSEECLAAIGTIADLETLDLSTVPLRGASLACLAGLKNLKSLRVNFWQGDWNGSGIRKPVMDDCFRAIATLTQLEWLSLENLKVSNATLATLASLTNLKTLTLDLVTSDRPTLSHLPALPRLEALDLSQSNIDDDDLRRLAVLPHLKSISLGNGFSRGSQRLTPAGIAELAAVESLEEVELEGDNESAAGIEALLAVKRLKRLHLGGNPSVWGDHKGTLTLDDGKELHVSDLEGFQRAMEALRKSKPGIVIAKYGLPAFQRQWHGTRAKLSNDATPDRPSSWLPGGDTKWMTPLELADFAKAGGRVNFGGATFPDREGKRLLTADF